MPTEHSLNNISVALFVTALATLASRRNAPPGNHEGRYRTIIYYQQRWCLLVNLLTNGNKIHRIGSSRGHRHEGVHGFQDQAKDWILWAMHDVAICDFRDETCISAVDGKEHDENETPGGMSQLDHTM